MHVALKQRAKDLKTTGKGSARLYMTAQREGTVQGARAKQPGRENMEARGQGAKSQT